MNRKQIIDFCNTEIFPQVDVRAWAGNKEELWYVVYVVEGFRRENGFPEEMTAMVDDGFLYLNGKPVERIARALNRPAYAWSEGAEYWEGRILARQES